MESKRSTSSNKPVSSQRYQNRYWVIDWLADSQRKIETNTLRLQFETKRKSDELNKIERPSVIHIVRERREIDERERDRTREEKDVWMRVRSKTPTEIEIVIGYQTTRSRRRSKLIQDWWWSITEWKQTHRLQGSETRNWLTDWINYLLTNLLTYLRTYLLTYELTYLRTYELTYLLTYLLTYFLYLLTYLMTGYCWLLWFRYENTEKIKTIDENERYIWSTQINSGFIQTFQTEME